MTGTQLLQAAAAAGAWLCLEDIDHLPSPMQAILAQHIATLQSASATQARMVRFGGAEVPLRATCAVLATASCDAGASVPAFMREVLQTVRAP